MGFEQFYLLYVLGLAALPSSRLVAESVLGRLQPFLNTPKLFLNLLQLLGRRFLLVQGSLMNRRIIDTTNLLQFRLNNPQLLLLRPQIPNNSIPLLLHLLIPAHKSTKLLIQFLIIGVGLPIVAIR